MTEAQKRYVAANPDQVRLTQKKHRDSLRSAALVHYGSKCACCGEDHKEFLAIDHKQGGGAAHRREIGIDRTCSSSQFFRWLRRNNYPPEFRVLCHNCNMSMGAYDYCPHQKEVTDGTN